MQGKTLLAGLALAGAAFAASLAGGNPAGGGPSPSPSPLPGALPAAAPASAWPGELALDRAADGHFYAEVEIGHATTRMLVDTGASVIALTAADAEAAGLYWDPAEVTVVGEGASGPVHGVSTRLDLVRLGGFEARDVDAVIVPEGLGLSLLGQSFLATIDRVEIASDRLLLEDAG